jgi:hypothetical protein
MIALEAFADGRCVPAQPSKPPLRLSASKRMFSSSQLDTRGIGTMKFLLA